MKGRLPAVLTTLAVLLPSLAIVACSAVPGSATPSPSASPPLAASPPPSASPVPSATSVPFATAASSPSGTVGIDGRQFVSTSVSGYELVPGTLIRLTFDGDSIGAQAGCNSIFGKYSLNGDVLVVSQLGMTEMGCQQPLMAQDEWIISLLSSQPRLTLIGDQLELASDSIRVEFLDREVAEPDQPLTGVTWNLTTIITGDSASSVPAAVSAFILLNADGTVSLQDGCNSGGGDYSVDGDQIRFGVIVMTRLACLGDAGEVEQEFLAVLNADSVTYAIDANTLTLQAGEHGLQFSATVDLPANN